jgi:hypothetical protein
LATHGFTGDLHKAALTLDFIHRADTGGPGDLGADATQVGEAAVRITHGLFAFVGYLVFQLGAQHCQKSSLDAAQLWDQQRDVQDALSMEVSAQGPFSPSPAAPLLVPPD